MSARIFTLAIAALLTASTATAHAQKAAELKWGPAPPGLPAGAKVAVISGDPGKPGPFAIQLALPNGYVVPPHFHPSDEHVTVKTGHFRYGMGDKIDTKAMKSLRPGQSVDLPATMHHYAMARGRTVLAINTNGPFMITYVNPSDDPRKMKP
jgi:quercetin dioxygenase-like cupin family protein